MKKIVLSLCILLLINCQKKKVSIKLLDYFDISWSLYSIVSGMESDSETFAEK